MLRFVEIKLDGSNHYVRQMYVKLDPALEKELWRMKQVAPTRGVHVNGGQTLGKTQDIHVHYPASVPNHQHIEYWEGPPKERSSYRIDRVGNIVTDPSLAKPAKY